MQKVLSVGTNSDLYYAAIYRSGATGLIMAHASNADYLLVYVDGFTRNNSSMRYRNYSTLYDCIKGLLQDNWQVFEFTSLTEAAAFCEAHTFWYKKVSQSFHII